ncbi:zinc-binding dehydrogenase [Chitinophaga oryziterrae]|uniref:Zinc-binding dehydrogenase n=1 Tax=Chitinophaga oryziterrae TaxID=1031224 RepID=A0A6N8J952_9BACT|nr:zinc-dependent alcohol dehydrogenase family protein [Chitinophaga oryziterrae]MVT41760.1 zinc-binding dehydrogenase [Chitinophaga oryziterrae]
MKAIIIEKYGEALVLKEMDRPVATKGQVLVKIIASAVNPLDTKIRAGKADHARHPLPAVPGIDMAGIVVEAAEGFKVGDEVYGMTGGAGGNQGSLAEYAAVDARLLALKPANLSMREAAAIPLAFITAWEGLVDRAHVQPGKQVLIQGGAGGVGHIAIQIAKSKGAEVFATGRVSQKEIIERFGATFVEGGGEYDIIFDTIGGTVLDESFKLARVYTGHVLSALGWGTHSLAPLSFKGATYSGVFTLRPLLTGEGREHHGEIMREATKMAEAGLLKPLLDPRRFTLETVNDAYDVIENKTGNGKLVVDLL